MLSFTKARRFRIWIAEYFFLAIAWHCAWRSAIAWSFLVAASAETANEPASRPAATRVKMDFMTSSSGRRTNAARRTGVPIRVGNLDKADQRKREPTHGPPGFLRMAT